MLGTYHLTVLYDVIKDLHFLYQNEKIYSCMLENLMKALDADAASIFLMSPKKDCLMLRACIGPKKGMMDLIAEEMPFPLGVGVCGWVAQFNQSVIIDDVTKDQRFSPQVDALTGYKTRSVLCAPLSHKDAVLGTIEILNKKSSVFNKNDLDLISLIAKQTAIALQNAQLYTQLTREKNFNDSIITNLTGGFISIDAGETITHMNPIAEKILQLPAADVIGKNCYAGLKYFPDLANELGSILKTKERKVRQEMQCNRSDGSTVRLGYGTFLVEDKAGDLLGSAINFQDLTQFAR